MSFPKATPPAENSAPAAPTMSFRAHLVCFLGFVAVAGAGVIADAFVTPPSETRVAAAPSAARAGGIDGSISGLELRLRQNPADSEGWRMLGWAYFNTQRFGEAAEAYARAAALEPNNLDFQSSYAEALVQAAGGRVEPGPQKIFEAVLARNSTEMRARFYLALAREQAGDHGLALKMWTDLLADAPAGAGWIAGVKSRIAGIQARTPGLVPQLTGSSTVPAAGGHQSATDDMIAKLGMRLESNPRDRDGWAMMIRSRSVTGDVEGAHAALARARTIFAGDNETLKGIEGVARELGLSDRAASEPRPEDIAAIAALPEADQKAMIRGMVEGLAERLKTSPHDAEGWIRLIRSRIVLSEPDLAREALWSALAEFEGDAGATAKITEAARGLGMAFD